MYKLALSPLDIGGVTVKNRIVRTPHVTHFAGDGIGEQFIAFHEARAKGGVGLSVLEGLSVHPSSLFHAKQLKSWDDTIIDGYKRFVDRISPHGMKVFQQIWHGGFQYGSIDGEPPLAPSTLPGPYTQQPATAMRISDIRMIQEAFVDAARRTFEGNLDGVELACAHGYLLQQFLSPWSNRREDEYGGDLEARARFTLEIAAGIRQVVPASYPIGLRIGPEAIPGGLGTLEIIQAIEHFEGSGLFDYVNLSVGVYQNLAPSLPGVQDPAGAELDLVGEISRATKLRSIVTGRFRLLDEVEQVLRDGVADLIGMTRAHIADPEIVRKTLENREDEIRPCIGCNQMCVAGMFSPSGEVQCTVNPLMSREWALSDSLNSSCDKPRQVLVVGGGPAGLEAARVARSRGHSVTLCEAAPDLGGTVRLAAKAPRLMGLADITDWQQREIFRLGVNVRTNTYLEAADVIEMNPHVVILAVGSMPREDGLQLAVPTLEAGLNGSASLSSWDIMSGSAVVKPDATYVVYDDTGHFEAAAVSEYLLSMGAGAVHFVTRFTSVAQNLDSSLRPGPAMQRLFSTGKFFLHGLSVVQSLNNESKVCEIQSLVGAPGKHIELEALVYVGYNVSLGAELLDELRSSDYTGDVEIIGDAKSSRYLSVAIHEGFFAGANC